MVASFPVCVVLSLLCTDGVVADLPAATTIANGWPPVPQGSITAASSAREGGITASVRSAVLRREPRGDSLLMQPVDRSDDTHPAPGTAKMVEEEALTRRENASAPSTARSGTVSTLCKEGEVLEVADDVGEEALRQIEIGDVHSHRSAPTREQSFLAREELHQGPQTDRHRTDSMAFGDFQNMGKGELKAGITADSGIVDNTKGQLSRGVYFDPALHPPRPSCRPAPQVSMIDESHKKADALAAK